MQLTRSLESKKSLLNPSKERFLRIYIYIYMILVELLCFHNIRDYICDLFGHIKVENDYVREFEYVCHTLDNKLHQ